MRIVHVANFYGPKSGGIKTTLHELGRGYKEAGHEFIYIVPGIRHSSEVTEFGRRITLPSFLLPGTGSYRVIKSNRELREYIAHQRPDRLEVSDRFTLTSLGQWARERNLPTVVFSHETLRGLASRFLPSLLGLREVLVNWHNRRLARSFDTVIATTDFAAKEFLDVGAKNIKKVPLGVDLQTFLPTHRSFQTHHRLVQGADLLLMHCGRLSPEKEPHRSIEALVALRSRGVEAHLVYLGTGPQEAKLRKRAHDLPVTFLGYVPDRRIVAELIASSDVSLAPGPLETFCLSALESLASGTPVVASSSSAVGEFLVGSPVAGAIAADNGESFADAIIDIFEDHGLRKAAREVAEKLPWSSTITAMLQVHGYVEQEYVELDKNLLAG